MEKTHQLIDSIYAAALRPSEWPCVLQSLQRVFNANAAGIYLLDTEKRKLTPFELQGIDESYVNSYIRHYMSDNPWLSAPEFQVPGKIRTDQSLDKYYNSPGFYRKTDYFNEWLEPQDFYYSLGVNLCAHQSANTKFYMYRSKLSRPFSKREITQFKFIAGHMTRSIEMTRRLAFSESQLNNAFYLVDQLNFGVIFFDEHATIIQANQFAQTLMREADGLSIKNRNLVTSHTAEGKKLSGIIQSALNLHRGQSEPAPCTINIDRPSGKPPFYVTAIPLPQQSDPFSPSPAAFIVFICDSELDSVIPTRYLQRRYGLTPSEAKLAQRLSHGDSLREVAEQIGLTYETARWYLKIIFQKTGVRRQAELLRLLLSDQVFVAPLLPAQK